MRNIIINAISIGLAVFAGATLAKVQVSHWNEVEYVEPIKYPVKEVEIVYQDTVTIEQEAPSDDFYLLASMIETEAGNQSFIGKVAVGVTAVNRVEWLDESLGEVICSANQYAYGKQPSEESIRAAECAIEYGKDFFPDDMVFFRTDYYHDIGEPYEQIGDHYFSVVEGK